MTATRTFRPTSFDPSGAAGTVNTALNAHKGDHGNPHGVTAGQAGAYTTAQVDALIATLNSAIAAAQTALAALGNASTHSASDFDPAGSAAAAAAASLPLAGGTLTGPIHFNSNTLFMDNGPILGANRIIVGSGNDLSDVNGLYMGYDGATVSWLALHQGVGWQSMTFDVGSMTISTYVATPTIGKGLNVVNGDLNVLNNNVVAAGYYSYVGGVPRSGTDGSFTSADGKTVSVSRGLIYSIV